MRLGATQAGYDLVVVGAGIIGGAVAFAAAKRGWSVLVLDKNGQAGHGSTSASAGIVRVHAFEAASSLLADEAVPIWQEWSDFLGASPEEDLAEFRQCGTIILDEGSGYVDGLAAVMRSMFIAHEYWSGDELRSRVPYMDLGQFGPPRLVEDPSFWSEPADQLRGALHTPTSGFVSDPALAAVNLIDAALRHGAELSTNSEVVDIDVRGERVHAVVLDGGTRIRAAAVLNAAGPHSNLINRMAGAGDDFRVRCRALREELHHVPVPSHIDYEGQGFHVVDPDLGINFRPELGNAILVGGNGAAGDPVQVIDDPDDFDPNPTRSSWDRQVLRLCRRIPDLGMPSRPLGVAGLYDATDDWLPIYDATGVDGFFVAIGTSGNQFKTAPVVGEMVAHLIEAHSDGRDGAVRPLKGPISGREISLAPYSRLREPHAGGARG